MRLLRSFASFLVLSLLAIAGCRHAAGPEPSTALPVGNPQTPSGPQVPEDTALCFSRDILPIFISSCARSGCHDAASRQDGYVFTSYQTITAKKFTAGDANDCELYEAITETDPRKRMPPAPAAPLTAAQIALIGRWINEGALDRGNCPPRCDSSNFTYAAVVQPLLTTYCTGCHSGAAASGGVRLDSHTAVQAAAASGRLLGAVAHAPGFRPMPQGGAKLSDCQIAQLRKWIEGGAPNN